MMILSGLIISGYLKKGVYELKVYPKFPSKWEERIFNEKNVVLLKDVLDIALIKGWFEVDFISVKGDRLGLGIAFHFGNMTQSSLVQKNSCRRTLVKKKNIYWSRRVIPPLIDINQKKLFN